MSTLGDIMSTSGWCSVDWGDIMMHVGDIMSTSGDVQYIIQGVFTLFECSSKFLCISFKVQGLRLIVTYSNNQCNDEMSLQTCMWYFFLNCTAWIFMKCCYFSSISLIKFFHAFYIQLVTVHKKCYIRNIRL